jgi:hypothetical protein
VCDPARREHGLRSLRLTGERRSGLAAAAVGILLVGIAQWLAPLGAPPLYDGVQTVAPYRWLIPPAGAAGGAQGASGTVGLQGGKNRLIAIATPELQPQAQLFATSGTFVLPTGTTAMKVSIEPVLPHELPGSGHIEGNVYRFSITNQAGVALTAPASAEVTVGLRGPFTTAGQVISVDDGSGWRNLKTDDAGFAASYIAVVTGGGDYAMVAPGPGGPYPTATPLGGGAASAGPSAAGSAASAGPSAGPSSGPAAPSIGEIGGSTAPSQAPAVTESSSGDGPPIGLIGLIVIVALVILGVLAALRNRNRRPPPGPRYQGAHRR